MRVLAVLTLALVTFAVVGVHAEEASAERNLGKNGLLVPKTSSHLSDVIARIKAQLGLAHSHKDMAMESAQGKKEKKTSVVSLRNKFMLESKQQKKQHSQ